MDINHMPDDILLEIFGYVDKSFLVTCIQLVCKRWRDIAFSPPLWRTLSLYSSSPFVSSVSNYNDRHRQNFLNSIGRYVLQLRTRVPFFWSRFDPVAFSDLRCLYIRMYETDTIQKIGEIIDCFKSIETFKLDISTFSGLNEIITVCKRLTSLRKFHLRHFFCNHSPQLKLMPHAFQVLFQKTNLTHVYVSCGDIHLDLAVKTLLKENRGLVELDLSRCSGVTSVAFSELSPCLSLRSLKLCRTGIDDDALKAISENVPNLSTLSISRCVKISDTGVRYIANRCKFLQDIIISNEFLTESESCHVTHAGIHALAEGCRELRRIDMNSHDNQIDSSVLVSIGQMCTQLQVIKLFSCKSVDDDCLNYISDLHRTLRVVNFSDCTNITGVGVSRLLYKCLWLQQACFKSCLGISSVSFPLSDNLQTEHEVRNDQIAKHSHVNTLNFRYCSDLDVASHISISLFCLDLVELYISGWFEHDPDHTIVKLVQRCNNLQVIECTGAKDEEETNFTDASLYAMAEYGHNLKRLIFVQNKLITIDGFRKVIQNCNNLREISVYVNDSCVLSADDVQSLTNDFTVPKVGVHKYSRLTTTCFAISIQQY